MPVPQQKRSFEQFRRPEFTQQLASSELQLKRSNTQESLLKDDPTMTPPSPVQFNGVDLGSHSNTSQDQDHTQG